MHAMVSVRVVVSDPQPVFRYGLRRLIESGGQMQFVGEASDPNEAIEIVRERDPDVLVVTALSPVCDADALRRVAETTPKVRCILVTDVEAEGAAIAAGNDAVGCVLPRVSTGSTFMRCINCVLRHQCFPVPRCGGTETTSAPPASPRYRLTGRETQILAAVAEGASNKDIASQLAIAEDTVKHHVSNIFDKFGVHSRVELAVFALYHGFVAGRPGTGLGPP
jgi:DNA-binding NarL/FixJ family response regulator